ncbi:MAG: DUF805 domain-containing protein [Pseudomonadota bacterium]
MGFGKAVHVCFQDYFRFSGRARRPEFWWFMLFGAIGNLLTVSADLKLFGEDKLIGLEGLFILFMVFPLNAVAWRRLHDVGRSGLWNLAPIPLYFLAVTLQETSPGVSALAGMGVIGLTLVVLYWCVIPGEDVENRFGPPLQA